MFNNKLVDWLFDNGVSTFITTDSKRNIFYDKILSRNVKDKICVDIGFGTGLLSFLAIKHGAKFITAFETNYERYLLGLHLIEKLGLQDKIKLVNARFETNLLPQDCELIFQEIFDQELWADGLSSCIATHSVPVLPNKYRMEFYLYELSEEEFKFIFLNSNKEQTFEQNYRAASVENARKSEVGFNFYNQKFIGKGNYLENAYPANVTFDPLVDFPGSEIYKKEIQNYIDEFWSYQKSKKIHQVSNINHKLINFPKYQELVNKANKVAQYEIDYNAKTISIEDYKGPRSSSIERTLSSVDVEIPADMFKNKITILLPVSTIGNENVELVVMPVDVSNNKPLSGIDRTVSNGGWDIPYNFLVFINPIEENQTKINLRQYLDSGIIRCWND